MEDEAKELVKEVHIGKDKIITLLLLSFPIMLPLLGRIRLSLKASRWGEEGRVGEVIDDLLCAGASR